MLDWENGESRHVRVPSHGVGGGTLLSGGGAFSAQDPKATAAPHRLQAVVPGLPASSERRSSPLLGDDMLQLRRPAAARPGIPLRSARRAVSAALWNRAAPMRPPARRCAGGARRPAERGDETGERPAAGGGDRCHRHAVGKSRNERRDLNGCRAARPSPWRTRPAAAAPQVAGAHTRTTRPPWMTIKRSCHEAQRMKRRSSAAAAAEQRKAINR